MRLRIGKFPLPNSRNVATEIQAYAARAQDRRLIAKSLPLITSPLEPRTLGTKGQNYPTEP